MAATVQARAAAASGNGPCAVRLENVTRSFGGVTALDGVSWGFRHGGFTAVMGPSGSGKSTFLHCASGLDKPTSGSVWIGDANVNELSETKRTRLRRDRIGFVFQAFNLIPSMTVEQNVTLPLRLAGHDADPARLDAIVRRVGLAERASHRPSELSGGQQQRAAIARALITRPEVIFADEPTGALDPRTARDVLRLLREAVDALGATIILVTHDPVAASYADSVLFLDRGRIIDELVAPTAAAVTLRWESM